MCISLLNWGKLWSAKSIISNYFFISKTFALYMIVEGNIIPLKISSRPLIPLGILFTPSVVSSF